jgi:SAM-dependent methyltransferase
MDNAFINPKWKVKTIDRYYHRKSLYVSLNNVLNHFSGKLLDVGCGKMPYREHILTNSKISEYVGLEIENALEYHSILKPDFFWDGVTMPFDNNSFDVIIATEVFEHCPDINIILSEINRVLKPNGVLYFTVPFLWTLHEVPYDIARYTPFALNASLTKNNFNNIEIYSLGGWHASMAQMMALWVRRAIGRKFIRETITFLLLPIILFLIWVDRNPKEFNNGQMCTGFSGMAKKSIS